MFGGIVEGMKSVYYMILNYMHPSASKLRPQTDEVNKINHLVTMVSVKWKDKASEHSVLQTHELEHRKLGM